MDYLLGASPVTTFYVLKKEGSDTWFGTVRVNMTDVNIAGGKNEIAN